MNTGLLKKFEKFIHKNYNGDEYEGEPETMFADLIADVFHIAKKKDNDIDTDELVQRAYSLYANDLMYDKECEKYYKKIFYYRVEGERDIKTVKARNEDEAGSEIIDLIGEGIRFSFTDKEGNDL